MNAKNLSIIAIVLWFGAAGFLGFKFVTGKTLEATDGREAIVLTAGERDFILTEMRGMLEGVQEIIAAINAGDMKAVQETTHRIGMAEVEGVPPETMLKLPIEFKQLGRATHAGFDEVGLAAELGPEAALERLEENLSRCVSCHASYRFVAQ